MQPSWTYVRFWAGSDTGVSVFVRWSIDGFKSCCAHCLVRGSVGPPLRPRSGRIHPSCGWGCSEVWWARCNRVGPTFVFGRGPIRGYPSLFDGPSTVSNPVARTKSKLSVAAEGAEILCKPWKPRNGDLLSKEGFSLDLRSREIACPAGRTESIELGKTTTFNASDCDACRLRSQCTTAALGNGRSVSILEDELLQKRLRTMSKCKSGRQRFRERIPVEHSLAHIGQRQGPRARYLGARKNLFDLRRAASVQNLEIAQRRAANS